MKPTILAILIAILAGVNLWAIVPQETHEPTYCTTENRDKAHKCDCVMQDPTGCKDGKRDTEMSMCKAYCAKEMCHCCAS